MNDAKQAVRDIKDFMPDFIVARVEWEVATDSILAFDNTGSCIEVTVDGDIMISDKSQGTGIVVLAALK